MLYRKHQIELYGLLRGLASIFADRIETFIRPPVAGLTLAKYSARVRSTWFFGKVTVYKNIFRFLYSGLPLSMLATTLVI